MSKLYIESRTVEVDLQAPLKQDLIDEEIM